MGAHGGPRLVAIMTFNGIQNALVMVLPALRSALYVENPHALFAHQADDRVDQRQNEWISGGLCEREVKVEVSLDECDWILARAVHHVEGVAHRTQMLLFGSCCCQAGDLRLEDCAQFRQVGRSILLADAESSESTHDFGKDILPRILSKHRVFAFNFVDENRTGPQYWRDIGTLDAYYEANMDLVAVSPIFNLYDKSWPLRTWQHQYPPVKSVFADQERMGVALDSIVGSGSIISGGRVKRSVLGYDVRVNSYCEIENSIIFNHVNIGRYSRIRNAIIDRHVSLPEHTEIGYDAENDRNRYGGTEGGVVTVVREESMLEEPD